MSRKKGSLGRVESSRGIVPVTKQVSAISGVRREPSADRLHPLGLEVFDEVAVPGDLPHELDHVVRGGELEASSGGEVAGDEEQEVDQRSRLGDDGGRMPQRVLAPTGEPAVGQPGPVVRGRDRHDGLDLLADGVRLLVPGVAVEGLRAGEKLGIDTARAVADEVDALDARELLTNAREVLKERSLPMTEAVGRE